MLPPILPKKDKLKEQSFKAEAMLLKKLIYIFIFNSILFINFIF